MKMLAEELRDAWAAGYDNGYRDVPPPAPGAYREHRSPTRMRTAYINGWRCGKDARERELEIVSAREEMQSLAQ